MEEKWTEILIRLPSADVDLVTDRLAGLGCAGVVVEERQLDTFVPPDPEQAPPEYTVKAYFADSGEEALVSRISRELEALAGDLSGPTQVLCGSAIDPEDWAEGWKQHFGRFRIGRLVVKPSWEEYAPAPEEAVVTLDPGMAFGTGTHATTRLCLEALADVFESPEPPDRVLDVGTGSGILAVAAAALGAGRVLACDIEPESCRTAMENARLNGVADRVEVTLRPLEELPGEYEVVLANILAEENIRLAPALVQRLSAGGHLILSGILQEKEAAVAAAFALHFPEPPRFLRREEWSCLIYRLS